jgi:hypothetical protein
MKSVFGAGVLIATQNDMLLLVLAGLVGLVLLAIWQGFVPPPHASTLIRISDGVIRVRRGRVRADAKEHIAEILESVGVSNAYIAITPGNWVAFSRSIPPTVHQRLRNVLLNQWA